LVVSPANTNDCWPEVVDVELVTPADEPALDRNSIQGTGTCFALLLVELADELVAELLDGVLGVLVVDSVPVLEVKEITAKSTRPDVGLKITSFIVPMFWP